MPTPVSTARQCLTEEAARVLDDAVAVARRRCHAQTTSLHAVSALLSLPSSLLRDACSRARSPAYSPRLQFRALDLCVSVSLDRLPSAKSAGGSTEDDPPPVSNSLMAAIKRSQANQRRQPEMYQITHHISSSICSLSSIKVELKNFVISILDDPIVSRVLGDAGFRSTEIKIAILHPPPPPARFFRGGTGGRCPPLFLCNLTDSGLPIGGNIPFPFPRAGPADGGAGESDGDPDCRRIGEVLVNSSGRNPLLVGVCAKEALASFTECVEKHEGEGVLPRQIVGLELISMEKEITEFLLNGGSKDVFDSKMEELGLAVEKHSGPGVVVNYGELKVLMDEDGGLEEAVKFLVQKLTALLELHKKKIWLIGSTANYETYRKFLDRFPSLEADWDLHPLPITSTRSTVAELSSKSSLMGSFVPFGGFFSTPSDFRNPLGVTKKPFTQCSLCKENFDREVSAISKGDSSLSVSDQHSSSLPSWLQTASLDTSKSPASEVTVEKPEFNAKISELQRKWDDTCRRLHQGPHHVPRFTRPDAPMVNPTVPGSLGFQSIASSQWSNDPSRLNLYSTVSTMVQKPPAQEPNMSATVISLNDNFGSKPESASHVSPSSVSSLTIELQLGTFPPVSQELKKRDSHFIDRPVNEKASNQVSWQVGEYKQIVQKLTEKVPWQADACCEIAQVVSRRGEGKTGFSWICFIGPDRLGKKKMAGALAELLFGSRENLIAVDLSVMIRPHSVFDPELPDDADVKSGRKSVLDYIADKLRKKPCSVVFLENVNRTDDLLIQTSLSHAVQSGKLRDSRGREISIMNAVFLIGLDHFTPEADSSVNFTEERILEACSWQMKIVTEHGETGEETSEDSSTVTLKRKRNDAHNKNNPSTHKKPKGFLDLNLPIEEEEIQDWFQGLLGQVEAKITFKPYNFDACANQLLNKMNLALQSRSDIRLEIEQDCMIQILAAVWCSEDESAMDNWIHGVLADACVEAKRQFGFHRKPILKMVSCPGKAMEKRVPGICLPGLINIC